MNKVLIISMPFATTEHPSIGISLLKARLHQEGISCDLRYFNLDFAELIGRDQYEDLCECQGDKTLLREWLFSHELFNGRIPTEQEYGIFLKKIYNNYQVPEYYTNAIMGLRRVVRPFLDFCMTQINWEDYDIVGFTSLFEQNLSSLSLASRVKGIEPRKIIVFGGANCERELGLELHRNFPFIDYVCSGEADFTFPELVKRIREAKEVNDIPGIIYWENGVSIVTAGSGSVEDLDRLPYPDYDDFFCQIRQKPASFAIQRHSSGSPPGLPMETSRGCWWGEKSKCAFCSLHRGSIKFRSKTADRIMREISHLTNKYNASQLFMVDNILNMSFFEDLLPQLQKKNTHIDLFYETKSNLSNDQVKMMHDAGISVIQPGIESLSSHVLKLMRKGVTALQNIQLLKSCEQFGVVPGWSIITGFPAELKEDYEMMIEMIPKIVHLPPPHGHARFSLQRFSFYFTNPARHGLTHVRPEEAYKYIYPFPNEILFRLAYYFDFDYDDEVLPPDIDDKMSEALESWKLGYAENASLYFTRNSPSTIVIYDGRPNAETSPTYLEWVQKDIYEFCSQIRRFNEMVTHLRKKHSSYALRVRDVRDFLEEMQAMNLMISEGDRYLSLAISAD